MELLKAISPWINFIILVGLLVKLLAKPFKGYLQKRHDTVKEKLSEAERLLAEAQEAKAAYEERLSKLDAEVESFRRSVLDQLEQDKKRILDEAQSLAKRIREQAQLAYDQEMTEALAKIRAEIVQSTLRAATHKLQESFKKDDHDRMVEDFIQKVRSIN